MHEEQASPAFGECTADGADPAFQSDGSCEPVPDEEQNSSRSGPKEEPPEAAAAAARAGTGDAFARAATATTRENVEESEAVRLLDEELAELEKLMVFQRKKIDALGRLRRQWLTGERYNTSTNKCDTSKPSVEGRYHMVAHSDKRIRRGTRRFKHFRDMHIDRFKQGCLRYICRAINRQHSSTEHALPTVLFGRSIVGAVCEQRLPEGVLWCSR